MAILTNIRSALATQLHTIPGLQAFEYIPDSFTVPAALVGLLPAGGPAVEYDANLAGATFNKPGAIWHVLIRLFVGKVVDKEAQIRIDAYIDPMGAKSIKQCLESNPTLSGACDDLQVVQAQGYGQFNISGIDYLGIDFVVTVYS